MLIDRCHWRRYLVVDIKKLLFIDKDLDYIAAIYNGVALYAAVATNQAERNNF